MNREKYIGILKTPIILVTISYALLAVSKLVLHSELLVNVFALCVAASILSVVYQLWKMKHDKLKAEEKLLEDCSAYIMQHYGAGVRCSKVTNPGTDPKFPTCLVSGPLQIEGSLSNIPFRFRIIRVYENVMSGESVRTDYYFKGYTLEWGNGYSHKEYIPHEGIDDFDIQKTMEMIQTTICQKV